MFVRGGGCSSHAKNRNARDARVDQHEYAKNHKEDDGHRVVRRAGIRRQLARLNARVGGAVSVHGVRVYGSFVP